MLVENTLYGLVDKAQVAIDLLRDLEPSDGYYAAYSGGKDSTVILDLVRRSGVKYDAHYNVTTVDPPELVQFIRTQPDVIFDLPEISMRNLIIKKGFPPTILARYCCAYLKEHGGDGRRVVTGVRAAESAKRRRRQQFESCFKDGSKSYLHIIFHWSTEEVWEYIKSRNLQYCSLYNEGWDRLGCICCPFGRQKRQLRDAERWPNFKKLYINAFQAMIDIRRGTEKERIKWQTGEEVWDWWLDDTERKPAHEGQTYIFE